MSKWSSDELVTNPKKRDFIYVFGCFGYVTFLYCRISNMILYFHVRKHVPSSYKYKILLLIKLQRCCKSANFQIYLDHLSRYMKS